MARLSLDLESGNWLKALWEVEQDAVAYLEVCKRYGAPAYLERQGKCDMTCDKLAP